MPVAQLNEASLYYESRGTGTAIIFVHGHGSTHRIFAPQLAYFSNYYRTIACDLRGNGQSGELRESTDAIIDTQCLDLIQLMNQLRIQEAIFVGISYGGLIVQQLAGRYPERVKAMVIVDSFCRSGTSTINGMFQFAATHLAWLADYAPAELLLPSLRRVYRRWEIAYRELRRDLLERRPRELFRQRLATSRIDYSALLAACRKPALCVAGEYSEYSVNSMKEMVSYLADAQLVIIPDAFEPSNLCQPDRFNAIVQKFLEDRQGCG